MHLRLLSLVCVLLIVFTGVVQAVHVHSENSKVPSHVCSVCSVAHSGVVSSHVYRSAPLQVRALAATTTENFAQSSDVVFSLHIRPPPAV